MMRQHATREPRRRRAMAVALLGLAACAAGLTACTSNSDDEPGGASGGPSGTAVTSGGSQSASGGTSSAPTAAACADGALAIAVTDVPGASGMSYAQIVITNSSAQPCSVSGYPTARMLNAQRVQVGSPASQIPADAAVIVLAPGDKAGTLLQDATSQCNEPNAAFLEVAAPGSSATVVVASELSPCALSLRPLTPGDQPGA